MNVQFFFTLILALFILALTSAPAFAYLDPATGSMIIQGIIGAIAGFLVAGKLYWYKLVSFFSRNKKSESDDDKGSH